MSNSLNIPEEFTFEWKVTNFDACFLHNHESFESPSFYLKNFCNTRWSLRLSLESHRQFGFEYVCALVREYDEGPTLVGVYFKVWCDSKSLTENFQTFTKGSKYDFPVPELYDFEKFPQMISLIFKCEMHFNFDDGMLAGNSNLSSYIQSCCLKPHLSVSNDNLQMDFKSTIKSINTHPKQGFAFSRYLVEKRVFSLHVHHFMFNVGENKQKLVALSFTDSPSISVEFSIVSDDDFDYLKINFLLLDAKLKSNLLLYSEVSFVDSGSETVESGRDYHLFKRNHPTETWSFGHFFDWNQIKLKANDYTNLQLNCQLFFFDGQFQSEILWTSDFGKLSTERILPSDILDKNALAEDIDVEVNQTLKSSNIEIETDQANISSIFSTLPPNIDSVIDFEYLDSETDTQKIKTEHSEYLEQSEIDNIDCIYSIKKFQTAILKEESRKFLEENLDVGNLCTVLIIANSHQDKRLHDSVIDFISTHKNRILKSKTWEKFAEKNYKLAAKILTEVCIRLPEKSY